MLKLADLLKLHPGAIIKNMRDAKKRHAAADFQINRVIKVTDVMTGEQQKIEVEDGQLKLSDSGDKLYIKPETIAAIQKYISAEEKAIKIRELKAERERGLS